MTQTKETRSSAKNPGGGDKPYESRLGPISPDHFENEPGPPTGLKGLDAEQRTKFDAETERLKQFRKK